MLSRFSQHEVHSFWIMLFCVTAVTALRVWFLHVSDLSLFFDEAQYWFWAKHLDVGYYSKPPVIAWIIATTTSLCGDGEACVRLGSPLLHMGTSIVLYFLGKRLYSTRTGFYSALAYLLIPAVTLSSSLISTDPPLLFFWSLSLLCFHKAVSRNTLIMWLLAGLFAGLGLMSKYTMILFLISAVWYLWIYADYRHYLRSKGFWLAILVALLVFAPNIYWNASHGFVSVLHTQDNASGNSEHFNITELLKFTSAQFGVFGPILFGGLLVALWQIMRERSFYMRDRTTMLLVTMITPLFATILTVSFISRAHANWAAPIYVPATVLVVHFFLSNWNAKRWLVASAALHLIVMGVFFYAALSPKPFGLTLAGRTNIEHNQIKDPFLRLRGWQELGDHVGSIKQLLGDDAVLLTHQRKTFAELIYYTNPPFYNAVNWQEGEHPRDHFMLVTSNESLIGKSVIYVAEGQVSQNITKHFEQTEMLSRLDIALAHGRVRHYEIVLLKGYRHDAME